MYRPVEQRQQQGSSVRTVLFSDKNFNTLQTVLVQDFQQRMVLLLMTNKSNAFQKL